MHISADEIKSYYTQEVSSDGITELTLEDCVKILRPLLEDKDKIDNKILTKILTAYAPVRKDLNPYVIFSDERYRRNLIHRCEVFELLVLCWKPGQISPIHNHKDSWCGIKVLEGQATEIQYTETAIGTWIPSSNTRANKGDVVCSHDTDTHAVGNFENRNLVTLHCYAPPLQNNEIVPIENSIHLQLQTVYETMPKNINMGNVV